VVIPVVAVTLGILGVTACHLLIQSLPY